MIRDRSLLRSHKIYNMALFIGFNCLNGLIKWLDVAYLSTYFVNKGNTLEINIIIIKEISANWTF